MFRSALKRDRDGAPDDGQTVVQSEMHKQQRRGLAGDREPAQIAQRAQAHAPLRERRLREPLVLALRIPETAQSRGKCRCHGTYAGRDRLQG